jgi:glucose/arabinose dehydrogenase
VLGFNADGTAVEGLWDRIHDQGRLRVAVQGPDGALYLTTDSSSGSILRVTGTPP